MKSNYKVLNSLDLSRNDILNASRVLGYDGLIGNDLEIATADTTSTSSGDIVIHAGAASTSPGVVSTSSGKIHLLAGASITWSNGVVSDDVNPRGGISRGLTINPDSSISLISDNANIVADAKTSIALRASSDGSTTASNKTSIILTSVDDKVAIKDTLFTLESSDDVTIATADLTTVTSDKFKISSTSSKYSLEANSTSKPSTSINGISTSYNSVLKVEAVDASEKINAQKDVEIAGNLKVRNTSSSFSKDVAFEVDEYSLESNDISLKYHGNTDTTINFKLESNSAEHKLTIDNIEVNEDTSLNNLSIEGDFSISNSGAEYVAIETPTYTNEVTENFEIKVGSTESPSLAVVASTSNSSINVDDISVDDQVIINNASKISEADPALDVRGALTVGKDTFLQGALRFNTSNGLIVNDNSSAQITIEETNIKLASTNTTITGSQVDINSSDNLNLTAYGASANLIIKSASSSGAITPGLAIIADSTTSSITADVLTIRGSQTFTGTTFDTSVSSKIALRAPTIDIDGTEAIQIDGASGSGLSIQGTTDNSAITVKNLTVSTSAGIQALSVTGNTTLSGPVNINGDINLTGNGLITSTAATKQIHIQANDIIDIRRSTSAGSTSNSILYADSASTYINASHLNLSTDLTYGKDGTYTSGKVHLTSTSASIAIPTSIVADTTGNTLSIQNSSTAGNALVVSGKTTINGITNISGSNLNITSSNVNIGTTTSTVAISGNNNLKVVSNDTSRGSFIQAKNVKVENTLNVSGFAIYYDSNTNSIVFAQGNL